MEKSKKIYERPIAEVVEFEVNDSIAMSADTGSGAVGTESIFGD